MSYLTDLARKIEEKLAADGERKIEIKEVLHRRHELREQRLERFREVAGRVAGSIIRPHMEQLAGYFENATVSSPESGCGHCVCRFKTSPRFPASTTLVFSVSHDETLENLTVTYDLEILPVFLEFEPHDSLTFAVDGLDEQRLEQWIGEKILAFVDIYLGLEQIEQYQKQNMVSDPVCGMRFDKTSAAAEVTHGESLYYFCSDDCRVKFVGDIHRYLGAPKSWM